MSNSKSYKKVATYLSKHPAYNATVHAIGGMGIGILIASPIIGPHPVRWGVSLLSLSLLGHIYPYFTK